MDSFAAFCYAAVPAWMALNMRRSYVKRYTVLAAALHLAIVSIRRPLFVRGLDNPEMWTDIHEITIALAGLVVIAESVYWIVWRGVYK